LGGDLLKKEYLKVENKAKKVIEKYDKLKDKLIKNLEGIKEPDKLTKRTIKKIKLRFNKLNTTRNKMVLLITAISVGGAITAATITTLTVLTVILASGITGIIVLVKSYLKSLKNFEQKEHDTTFEKVGIVSFENLGKNNEQEEKIETIIKETEELNECGNDDLYITDIIFGEVTKDDYNKVKEKLEQIKIFCQSKLKPTDLKKINDILKENDDLNRDYKKAHKLIADEISRLQKIYGE
jgi:hypothetical protein